MPNTINLRLLFISLLFSFLYARPGIFPSPSPAPAPDSPSGSPSPQADGPATIADGPDTVDESTTIFEVPSPSPEADGPTAVSFEARRSRPTLSPEPSDDFDPEEPTPGPSAADLGPKLKQMCESTTHSELCQAILLPQNDGNTPDVPAALKTAIQTSAQLANIGLVLAKTAASDPGVPPELASILVECRDSYDYAVYNFESTLEGLQKKDAGSIKSTLDSAVKDVEECEEGLSRYGKESPFKGVAEKLVNMTNECLAIAQLLN